MVAVSANSDYYPFGMLMPGRNQSSEGYRYGFNSAEKDNEIAGEGNVYDLGLREYDTRLGRMFCIDPRTPEYPWQSPYVYHRNNPVIIVDYLGGGDGQDPIVDMGELDEFEVTAEKKDDVSKFNFQNDWFNNGKKNNIFHLEYGILDVIAPYSQWSSELYSSNSTSKMPTILEFYELNPGQSMNPFLGHDLFDPANHYMISSENKETGLTYTFGITHDKLNQSGTNRGIRYEGGGMELTAMAGKTKYGKAAFSGNLYGLLQGGFFLSYNDVNVNFTDQNSGLHYSSEERGRSFGTGGAIIANLQGGVLWMNQRGGFYFSIGLGFTGRAGVVKEEVLINNTTNDVISGRYAAISFSPHIKFGFSQGDKK